MNIWKKINVSKDLYVFVSKDIRSKVTRGKLAFFSIKGTKFKVNYPSMTIIFEIR